MIISEEMKNHTDSYWDAEHSSSDFDYASRRKRLALERAFREDTGWILGVCAGLARKVGLNPAIVRIAAIIALIFHPAITVACYLLLWVIFFRSD